MALDVKLEKFFEKILETKALKKLQRHFQLDLKYFLKNYSYLTSAQMASLAIGILMSVAFARLLPKETYGQYNYILSVIGILAIFALPGMGTAISRAAARGHDGTLVRGVKEKFKWSILGSVGLIGVGGYYFLSGSILLGRCFVIASLLFPVFENFQAYNAFLSGKKSFGRRAKYQITVQIFSVLATFLALYFTRNLLIIITVSLASTSLLRGYFLRMTLKNMENQSDEPGAVSFGRHMTLVGIPGTITSYADQIIIGAFLSFPELATYTIAKGFMNRIKALLDPIPTLTFPKLAEIGEREAFAEVKKRFLKLVLLVAVVCGIAAAICPYLITFLYSQRYADSGFYAQLLLAALFFGMPVAVINKALLSSQRKIKEIYKLEVFHMVVEMVFLMPLIFKFGLLGVVLAKVASNLLVMLYSWRLARLV